MQPNFSTCKNCGNQLTGKYCSRCGEKTFREDDKTVRHLLGEAFHFTTHFEGTFFNTLKAILTRPGRLSEDYCYGIRKKYFKPMSFFLMLVILYLLFPVFEGLNQRLVYHMHNDWYGQFATEKVHQLQRSKGLTELQVSNLFHQKGEKTSKFLLFIIIPVMALVSWLMAFKKRRFYFDHFVFSTEISSFFILWGFLLLPVVFIVLSLAGINLMSLSEGFVGALIGVVFLIYLLLASRRFFQFRWWYGLIYSVLFTAVMIMFIMQVYKFILFVIAINLIA